MVARIMPGRGEFTLVRIGQADEIFPISEAVSEVFRNETAISREWDGSEKGRRREIFFALTSFDQRPGKDVGEARATVWRGASFGH